MNHGNNPQHPYTEALHIKFKQNNGCVLYSWLSKSQNLLNIHIYNKFLQVMSLAFTDQADGW
jgi:hypothetical protein